MIDGIMPVEHRMQLNFQMIMTGSDRGFFFAYSPDMQPLMIEVKADSYTMKMQRALTRFDRDYQEFRNAHLSKLKIGDLDELGKGAA